jgi:signal transduction histidine kinase
VAEERGMGLAVNVEAGPQLIGNRQLVVQAVANLIENAIKYSGKPGNAGSGAAISIDQHDSADAIEIAVADNGPGIAPEDRERVLKRFVRLEKSRTEPGTGLGLSLVQAVARLHGGSVRLEDNRPGLRVVLVLPKRGEDR